MSLIDDQAATWMVRRSGGTLAGEELEEFNQWYAADPRHQGAYLRAAAIDASLNRATRQSIPAPQTAAGAIHRTGSHWRWLGGVGTAAAAAVLMVVGITRMPVASSQVELATTKGEQRQFRLADQSRATLNSASALDVMFSDTARHARLQRGEAWFEVAKDKHKPFTVEAGDVRVRAVGTAFSVRRYQRGADVLVTEGVVEVWSNRGAGNRVLLSQGEQLFVPEVGADLKPARLPAEIERKLAWRQGKLVFANQTLAEAVADFNRYSPRKIVIVDPELSRVTFVGQYAVDAPEVFAKDVCTYLNVPLVITADAIMIGQARPAAGRSQNRDRR